MSNRPDGFVKLLARPGSGTIAGGAVVASYASDLIAPISEACFNRLTASQLTPGVPDLPVVRRVDPGVRPPPGRPGPGVLPVLVPLQVTFARVGRRCLILARHRRGGASDERHPCPPGCGWGGPRLRPPPPVIQMTAAVTPGRHHPDPTVLDQRGERRAGMSAAELGSDVCGTHEITMPLESAVRTAEPAPAWLGTRSRQAGQVEDVPHSSTKCTLIPACSALSRSAPSRWVRRHCRSRCSAPGPRPAR